MTDFNKALIETIRRRRVVGKMKQAGFAGKIGMTPRGYRYVEHGQTPLSAQRLYEVSIALDVSIAILTEEAEYFIQTGRLPTTPFKQGDTCAAMLDELRRRNHSGVLRLPPNCARLTKTEKKQIIAICFAQGRDRSSKRMWPYFVDLGVVKRNYGKPDLKLNVIVRPKDSPKLTLMRGVDAEMVVEEEDRDEVEQFLQQFPPVHVDEMPALQEG